MKIVSWNVNGIRACYKKTLLQNIEFLEPDIFCVQETKAHLDQVEHDVQYCGYKYSNWSSAVRKGYSGVAVFSDISPIHSNKGWGQEQYDSEGRIIINEYEKFKLYNIYFPNGGSGPERHQYKQLFLADLNMHLTTEKKRSDKPIIILGDYNVAHTETDVYDPIKLSKESGFLPEERSWFNQFLNLGFVDTFRHAQPDTKNKYTWWSYKDFGKTGNRGWRIDYICVSESLKTKIKKAEIYDNLEGSDHCPILLEVDI